MWHRFGKALPTNQFWSQNRRQHSVLGEKIFLKKRGSLCTVARFRTLHCFNLFVVNQIQGFVGQISVLAGLIYSLLVSWVRSLFFMVESSFLMLTSCQISVRFVGFIQIFASLGPRDTVFSYPQLLRVWNGRPSRVWLLGSNMVRSTYVDLLGLSLQTFNIYVYEHQTFTLDLHQKPLGTPLQTPRAGWLRYYCNQI